MGPLKYEAKKGGEGPLFASDLRGPIIEKAGVFCIAGKDIEDI